MAARVKKGDKVVVIAGRDKGREGEVMKVIPAEGRVIVAGVQYHEWLKRTAAELHRRGWKVVFRPHPRHMMLDIPGVNRTKHANIEDDLAGAGLAVTLNSNAGVLAVLYGTATVTCDAGAMAWDVSAHDFDSIVQPDREAWAARVAYSQWLLEEIADGTGWDLVRAAHPGNNGG